MTTKCKAPSFPAFDIDVYDCPCGHMYGSHEYGHYPNGDMKINKCLDCERTKIEFPSLDDEREHYTDGRPCWCGPTIERGRGNDGDVIIHRDREDAH